MIVYIQSIVAIFIKENTLGKKEKILSNCKIASHGIALGKVFIIPEDCLFIPEYSVSENDIEAEIERFNRAVEAAKSEYETTKQKFLSQSETRYLADILEAHIHILDDIQIKEEVRKKISTNPANVEYIVARVFERIILKFQKIQDPYLRERLVDIKDVRDNLIDKLSGREKISLKNMTEPAILIAHDIFPSDTAYFDPKKILGIITEAGGVTSHASIIAKGMGIPALVGVENVLSSVGEEDIVVLDGIRGQAIVNPREEVYKEYEEQRNAFANLKTTLAKLKEVESITQDGKAIRLVSNCEIPEELDVIKSSGAKGIGLLRTEFIFYRYDHLPDEEEQYEAYYKICKGMSPLPVVIRTLDLGGDKMMEGIKFDHENNPFLGWRSLRFCLDNPEIFRAQLRAILRVSTLGNVRIMFPMVGGLDELERTLAFLDKVKSELDDEGIEYDKGIELGIMVETPSSVIMATALSKYVQFLSIGTNDLIQYALAVDRGNEKIAYLFDPYHPAILRMIKMVIESAKKTKTAVSMCGEMAGDPFFTVLLIGMGLEEFSMTPASIPEIKRIIRNMRFKHSRKIADTVLNMESSSEVRAYLRSYMFQNFPELKDLMGIT